MPLESNSQPTHHVLDDIIKAHTVEIVKKLQVIAKVFKRFEIDGLLIQLRGEDKGSSPERIF